MMIMKKELGQVFTSKEIAKIMIDLGIENLSPNSSILDPCIGKNIFFKQLKNKNYFLTGIEIDLDLIDDEISKYYSLGNKELIIGDFFNLDISKKYDLIVMNPPYIRQENIKNKSEIAKITKSSLPKNSNLYSYFLIKSKQHLNKGGRIIAIVYDSWLYSKYGKFLKKIFSSEIYLNKILHIKNGAFQNALIGATIIELSLEKKQEICYNEIEMKGKKIIFLENQFFNLNELEKKIFNKNNLVDFSSNFFRPIEDISKKNITRGTSAICNEFFISDKKRFEYDEPFIKKVQKIKGYSVNDNHSYLLNLGDAIPSKKEKDYLELIKLNLKKNKKNIVLKKNIKNKHKEWFKIKKVNPGRIIFNYYMRTNIKFILNNRLDNVSDNFYNLYLDEKEQYSLLAILNSIFTKISLILNSRNQGNGLSKLQLFEFKKCVVPSMDKFEENVKKKLGVLGRQLFLSKNKDDLKILKAIDSLILNEYNKFNNSKIKLEELYSFLEEKTNG